MDVNYILKYFDFINLQAVVKMDSAGSDDNQEKLSSSSLIDQHEHDQQVIKSTYNFIWVLKIIFFFFYDFAMMVKIHYKLQGEI